MNNSINNKISKVINLFNSNKFFDADLVLDEILASEPNNTNALNIKGAINIKKHNYENAVKFFKKGLNTEPGNITLLKNIVIAHKHLKQYQEAAQHLEKIVILEKKSPNSIIELTNNLILLNQKEEALKIIESNINLENRSEILILAKANCLFELKKYQESEEIYKELYQIIPNNFQVLFRLGYLNLETEKYQDSISYFEKIIKIRKEFKNSQNDIALTFYNLGMCYEGINEIIIAEENYIQSIKYNDKHIDAYINLANIYEAQEKFSESIKLTNKAIKLNPEKRLLYMNLSNIYQKLGKHREAVFYKRTSVGSIVFKPKEEYGLFKIDKVELNEKI